ncbi:MAG TPA: hypothetical protein VMY59_02280 [Candidatus Thermoplasmatota archaeon]|nr:hypothetical protein [Candidatus Thermoplasmatota archaeon]
MAEKPFKDREEAKKQLKSCGNWCNICEGLAFLLIVIGIIWRVLKVDFGLDSTFWFLLAIFFAITSLAPHLHIASIRNLLGIDSDHK